MGQRGVARWDMGWGEDFNGLWARIYELFIFGGGEWLYCWITAMVGGSLCGILSDASNDAIAPAQAGAPMRYALPIEAPACAGAIG